MALLNCSLLPYVHPATTVRFFANNNSKTLELECMNKKNKNKNSSTSFITFVSSTNELITATFFSISGENPLKKTSVVSLPLPLKSADSLQYESGFLGAVPVRLRGNVDDEEMDEGGPRLMDYFIKILTSKVYEVAIETPLQFAPKLSERIGANIWLKREDLQPVFSFKLRGAYNMMAQLTRDQLDRGVICSSAGNHAQGVAISAQRLDCDAVIVMPVTTPDIKWKSVQRLGGKVILAGDTYDEAQAYAKQLGEKEGRMFIPPFDHPEVICGQGTTGMEIIQQAQGPLHAIFVPVGGGGLIAGIAAYVKIVHPEIKIIGVEPSDANALALSLHHGQRIKLDKVGGFADGVAVKEVGKENFRLCRELIDGVVLVSREAICSSMKDMFEEKRSILEPAGALALAGAEAYCKYYGIKGENVVAIASGANMNFDSLRLITKLADVGSRQESVLAIHMPEETGSFKQFCETIGPMNVTALKYRYDASNKDALVLLSVGVHTVSEITATINRMESSKYQLVNLTQNNWLKDHLQHLVGGLSNVEDELHCRFTLPEKPDALMALIATISPRWNITLLHYRAEGVAGAHALVGIQVPSSEIDKFRDSVDRVGYEYTTDISTEDFKVLML